MVPVEKPLDGETRLICTMIGQKLTNWLRHFLGTVQEPWYTYLNGIANRLILLRHPEKVVSFGKLNEDRTFYLIRDLSPYVGVAGWFDTVLGYMEYAERKGWIPVVEPQSPLQPDDGTWYDYFKGPSAVSLDEVYRSARVVVAQPRGMIHKRYNRENVVRRHRLAGMIGFSADVQTFVDARLPALFDSMPGDIVGVRFRGTDYRSNGAYRPVGHAIVPTIEAFCQALDDALRRWGIADVAGEHLLVVTEEQEALDALRKRYPRCRFVEKERYEKFNFQGYLCSQRLPTLTPRENNFMYMLEISALARCDYLFGGRNGGVLMALILNGNRYRGVTVLETGVN